MCAHVHVHTCVCIITIIIIIANHDQFDGEIDKLISYTCTHKRVCMSEG